MPDPMGVPSSSRLILTFVVLTIIWGTTWSVIRVGLDGIPPFSGVALRFLIAGAVLLAIALRAGIPLGRRPYEKRLWIINGVLSFSVSYGIVYWAEQWLPSGLASVLFATFPLFVAFIGHFALPGERLRAHTILGALLGFAGVAVIFSEDFSVLGGRETLVAAGVMLLSPLAASTASVTVKRWGAGIHPLSVTAIPMLITAGIMGVVAFALERDLPFTLDARSVGALLYLSILGSAVTFTGYFWLLSHVPATRAALIAYTTPVVAVLVGATFLDEPVTVRTLAGSACVVLGVALAAATGRRSRVGRSGR